jgi:hypothetical protein
MALVERDTRSGSPPPPPTPTPSRRNRVAAVIIALAVVVLAVVVIAATATGGSNHTKPRLAGGPATTGPTITNQVPSATAPGATSPGTAAGASSNPADWPAAQSNPPSLAGAMNTTDLASVVRTLETYKDWVYSHPDPTLVRNFELPSSSYFAGDTKQLQTLVSNHWHTTPNPTLVKFIRVTLAPRVTGQGNGKPMYSGSLVTVVLNFSGGQVLDVSGKAVITNPTNDFAYTWGLSYGADGQWRISDMGQLNPPGGIASLENQ